MKQKSAIDMPQDLFAYAEKLNPKCESLSIENFAPSLAVKITQKNRHKK